MRILIAPLFLLIANTLPGQRKLPRIHQHIEIKEDLPFAGTDNPRQTLDLYLPADQVRLVKKLPVIVYVHGGAWREGDKKAALFHMQGFASSGGYAVATLGYRLTDEAPWPAQIHDCKAAIRWIRGNAEKYGLDPDKIGAMGHSAGGHLVAMLGTSGGVEKLEGDLGDHDSESSKVTCVANFYGPSELLTMSRHRSTIDHDAPDSPESQLVGGPLQEQKEVARSASPITHISRDDPPFYTVHGTKDPLVPHSQSEDLHRALERAGCTSYLLSLEDAGHGSFKSSEVKRQVALFFAKYLREQKLTRKNEKIEGGLIEDKPNPGGIYQRPKRKRR